MQNSEKSREILNFSFPALAQCSCRFREEIQFLISIHAANEWKHFIFLAVSRASAFFGALPQLRSGEIASNVHGANMVSLFLHAQPNRIAHSSHHKFQLLLVR
jgi:hypothetical protein